MDNHTILQLYCIQYFLQQLPDIIYGISRKTEFSLLKKQKVLMLFVKETKGTYA